MGLPARARRGVQADRVFQVVAGGVGTMHVELRNIGSNGGFDGMLSAWKDTCTPGPALAFDGTTLTLQVNGVTVGTTTTLTNLSDEGMSIASFSSAALTPGVVVSRICYGFI